MANPTCSRASFVSAYACFQNLSDHQQKALMVYLKVLELNALGGTNYTGAGLGHSGSLLAAAASYSTMTPQQIFLSMLVVYLNNANAAGAAVSTNIQTIMDAIKCLDDFEDKMLEQMNLQVTCELGVHKTYPQ